MMNGPTDTASRDYSAVTFHPSSRASPPWDTRCIFRGPLPASSIRIALHPLWTAGERKIDIAPRNAKSIPQYGCTLRPFTLHDGLAAYCGCPCASLSGYRHRTDWPKGRWRASSKRGGQELRRITTRPRNQHDDRHARVSATFARRCRRGPLGVRHRFAERA